MSAGNGKGVRIEFDDENDNIGGGAAATGEDHEHDGGNHLIGGDDGLCFPQVVSTLTDS